MALKGKLSYRRKLKTFAAAAAAGVARSLGGYAIAGSASSSTASGSGGEPK